MNARESDLRTLEITTRERDLLLKYGYPFPVEEQKLRDSKAVKGLHRVRMGAYWIELMVADLIRSAREIRNGALLDELDALCSALVRGSSPPAQHACDAGMVGLPELCR
jgi:hypothetical protein